MPVIPEMDEFVNWDNAYASAGPASSMDLSSLQAVDAFDPNHDLDLVLENVDGDDFSYWALEHFEATNPAVTTSPDTDLRVQPHGFDGPRAYPEVPCLHCQRGRFQCKTINEGKFKGYCTSCVALRTECSFGLASQGTSPAAAFPSNPWPTLGDHPRHIREDVPTDINPAAGGDPSPELAASASVSPLEAESTMRSSKTAGGPKVGARFSREALKLLKNWLSTHTRHPYPTEEEKEMLQQQTGLNRTQITNWLANARRRGKIVAPRSVSPGVRSFSNPVDIPQRQGTPSPLNAMNPLERWAHSPPEHEPASVTDIARAITSSSTTASSGLNSPHSLRFTDDGSNRSLCAVSTGSSANTSRSSSAFSYGSRGSLTSFGSSHRGRRRRRRKAASSSHFVEHNILVKPSKTFQCTFCTQTFSTKHDWQRHEKSLHLSLERWVCTPSGPRAANPESNKVCCVFCGVADPDDAHIESHNHSACQDRSLDERTFYRKDHLRQHLRLMHASAFVEWSMKGWEVATPEIRSRCGFCGVIMDTWSKRVDHLAEHFKGGKTMADWTGDWGFEAPVLGMVENSIAPDLIHQERTSPLPYKATRGHVGSPRNCYELLKAELALHIHSFQEQGIDTPTDEQLQVEACRVIFGAETFARKKPSATSSTSSWLRDLFMSSEHITKQAQLAPIQGREREWMSHLQIIGKGHIFEDEPMETQLHEFVQTRSSLGITALDSELQVETCNILGRLEQTSSTPSDEVYRFLSRLICRSTEWLAGFRQRAHLPRSEEVVDENVRPTDPTQIDITIHNEKRLEAELAAYVNLKALEGIVPNDVDLQREARMIIYGVDDGWCQTVADGAEWLRQFKQQHLKPSRRRSPGQASGTPLSSPPNCTQSTSANQAAPFDPPKLGAFYLHDGNCYRRLDRELTRYVKAAMSLSNPNCHVPTDEELQHQARWILYDS